MCKYRKIKEIFLIWFLTLLWTQSQIFAFDLLWEMDAIIQTYTYSNDYMSNTYSSKYSKDPYWDALKAMSDMSSQVKISGVDYVRDLLKKEGCSMSQKKVVGILYYFSPDFRSEFVRTLKMNWKSVDSENYVLDATKISEYCSEYYKCVNRDRDKTTRENKEKISEMIAATPQTVEVNCREKFLYYYNEWKSYEERKQSIQNSQLWSDKYMNGSLDDSPYDLITDVETVWKFLFEGVESPITPVFYNLPVFSNTVKAVLNAKNSGGLGNSNFWDWSVDVSSTGWNNNEEENKGNQNGWSVSLADNSWWEISEQWEWYSDGLWYNGWINNEIFWSDVDLDEVYDDLVGWIWGYKMSWLFKWNLCNEWEELEEEAEPVITRNINNEGINSDFGWLTLQEIEDVIETIRNATDSYWWSLEEEREKLSNTNDNPNAMDTSENGSKRWRNGNNGTNPEKSCIQLYKDKGLDEKESELNCCLDACDDLRSDQKASCQLMCLCGEWKSEIFNPDKIPGLWPIAMIKFCTVPWIDGRFSVWGRKMVSIEEWINEIYGVVNKLSSEWKLWIWTQQNNFFDSTTKEINFWKMISFTINVEWADAFRKWSKQSQQFEEMEASKNNDKMERDYCIRSSLDNPELKNVNIDVTGCGNDDEWDTSISGQTYISDFDRRVDFSQSMGMWMDQEWQFRNFLLEQIHDWTEYANDLLARKW